VAVLQFFGRLPPDASSTGSTGFRFSPFFVL